MRIKFFIILLCLVTSNILSQSNDTWFTFYNDDKTLVGYKDKKGVVKIEPKYEMRSTPNRIDYIFIEEYSKNNGNKTVYLTKSGRQFGIDSIFYTGENAPDCESEGFIRFKDNKNDKVGLFNRFGKVIIPSEYNELSLVRNGTLVALKGAQKKYFKGGEHYEWIGGIELLIDTNNVILVENFKHKNFLNYYSLVTSKNMNSEPNRKYFKGKNNLYYSFIDYKEEFSFWIKTDLLGNFTKENFSKSVHSEVECIILNENKTEKKQSFIESNFELIKRKLNQIVDPKTNYALFSGDLYNETFNPKDLNLFFDNCGNSNFWRYPTFNLVINYKINGEELQDSFEFLKTDDGYKLFYVGIKDKRLK